jgi:hypothetical protein
MREVVEVNGQRADQRHAMTAGHHGRSVQRGEANAWLSLLKAELIAIGKNKTGDREVRQDMAYSVPRRFTRHRFSSVAHV